MLEPNVEIANIVASGKFDAELDLEIVAKDLRGVDRWINEAEHNRKSGNRLLIDITDNEALGILSPNGVYIFTGANSHDEINDARQKLMSALAELGIISSPSLPSDEIIDRFTIENMVCTADFEQELDLNAVAVRLGFENIEYEPEQFPGLVFRPNDTSCTIMVFGTGKVIVTGITNKEDAQNAVKLLSGKLDGF